MGKLDRKEVRSDDEMIQHESDGVSRMPFDWPEVRAALRGTRKPDFRKYRWLP